MKKIKILCILLVFFGPLALGCENKLDPGSPNNRIYFNSFESSADTVGWQGYGAIGLKTEAPVDGGEKSLLVSGGCFVPHASFEISPMARDSHLILKCWGKNLAIGGSVTLESIDGSNQISISIQDSSWTYYESEEALYCPANKPLRLSLNSGGFIYSAMLVDLIQITRVR